MDYYPFGWEMPGAERNHNSDKYRYGFNGKEKDQNLEFGSQTVYDYGFRIYNPAIAKFLSVDPLTSEYPWYTPYQFAGNKPIQSIDLDGLEEWEVTGKSDQIIPLAGDNSGRSSEGHSGTVYGPYKDQATAQEAADITNTDFDLPEASVTYQKQELPDPMGVNYTTGIFGDYRELLNFGDGSSKVTRDFSSKQSAEIAGSFFPVPGIPSLKFSSLLRGRGINSGGKISAGFVKGKSNRFLGEHAYVILDDMAYDVAIPLNAIKNREGVFLGKIPLWGQPIKLNVRGINAVLRPGNKFVGFKITQAQANAAMQRIKTIGDDIVSGKNAIYDIRCNSCASNARDILNAAGQNIPNSKKSTNQIYNFLKSKN